MISRSGKALRDPQPKSIAAILKVWRDGALVGSGAARGALLADSMGLGKTATSVVAARQAGYARVLVVCPKAAITDWQREIHDWHSAAGTVRVLRSGSGNNTRLNYHGWTISNFEMLERYAAELRRWQWDLIILDEAHALKEPEARRTILIHGGMWKGKA
jgi:SNF2 family DNA or RNA helicase